jgi:hypothetical protein
MAEMMEDVVSSEGIGRAIATAFAQDGRACDMLPVRYLFDLTGWPDKNAVMRTPGGPFGDRSLFTVTRGEVAGPALIAEVVQPCSNWATEAHGRRMIDVQLALRYANGQIVLMRYRGQIDGTCIHIAPRFEAVFDGPYGWLNWVQAVGVGRRNPELSLTYRIFIVN